MEIAKKTSPERRVLIDGLMAGPLCSSAALLYFRQFFAVWRIWLVILFSLDRKALGIHSHEATSGAERLQ
jgi:hypothetical protein